MCIALSFVSKAQCDKTIKWKSSKTEFIDAAGNVKRTNDETVEVTTTKTRVTIVVHGPVEETMSGDITDYSCNWTNKQNGKTSFKAIVVDHSGDRRHATITFEAINGKTTMLLHAEEEPDDIRLTVDSFEETE